MDRNLVGSILGRSSIKIVHLVPIRWQTWPTQAILFSDWLISKKLSPLKLLGQMNRNLVGNILGKSFIKIANLVLIRWQTWPPKAILVSDWLISKNSSLKPPCQMNRNLRGSIYGRSSIKIAHLVPIRYQTWPPQTILVSDWLISNKIFSSVTPWPDESKFGRKHPWKVLYKVCSFSSNPLTNMATTGNSCFWLVDF